MSLCSRDGAGAIQTKLLGQINTNGLLAIESSVAFHRTSSTTIMMRYLAATAALVGTAYSHGNHEQTPIEGPLQGLWYNTLPGDGGTQVLIEALGLRVLS